MPVGRSPGRRSGEPQRKQTRAGLVNGIVKSQRSVGSTFARRSAAPPRRMSGGAPYDASLFFIFLYGILLGLVVGLSTQFSASLPPESIAWAGAGCIVAALWPIAPSALRPTWIVTESAVTLRVIFRTRHVWRTGDGTLWIRIKNASRTRSAPCATLVFTGTDVKAPIALARRLTVRAARSSVRDLVQRSSTCTGQTRPA